MTFAWCRRQNSDSGKALLRPTSVEGTTMQKVTRFPWFDIKARLQMSRLHIVALRAAAENG
jgi:hypothetical protein